MIQFEVHTKDGKRFQENVYYNNTEQGIEAGYDYLYDKYPGAYIDFIG